MTADGCKPAKSSCSDGYNTAGKEHEHNGQPARRVGQDVGSPFLS